MKIVRFEYQGSVQYGFWEGDTVILAQGRPWEEFEPTSRQVPLSHVKLLAPVEPPNVYCIGLNYRQHAAESGKKIPPHPLLFLKPTTTVIGPGQSIVLPQMDEESVDYEAELAIVIKRKAKKVEEAQALDYVLGYTCAIDVSARKSQFSDGQWARGKSYDSFCPLGPAIETQLDPDQVQIRCRLNGQIMQDSNTSDMIFDCRKLVSFLSHCGTLLPGSVILTGTPSGVGYARKPPVFLKPGDVVEVEIEGIGVLSNPVTAEA